MTSKSFYGEGGIVMGQPIAKPEPDQFKGAGNQNAVIEIDSSDDDEDEERDELQEDEAPEPTRPELPPLQTGSVFQTEEALLAQVRLSEKQHRVVGPDKKWPYLYIVCGYNHARLRTLKDERCPWQIRAKADSKGRYELYSSRLQHSDHPADSAGPGLTRHTQVTSKTKTTSQTTSTSKSKSKTKTTERAIDPPHNAASVSRIPQVGLPQLYHEGDLVTADSPQEARQIIKQSIATFHHDFMSEPASNGGPQIHLVCRQNRTVNGVRHAGCCPAEIRAVPTPTENTWKITAVNCAHQGHWSDEDGRGLPTLRGGGTSTGADARHQIKAPTQTKAPRGTDRASKPSAAPSTPHPASSRRRARSSSESSSETEPEIVAPARSGVASRATATARATKRPRTTGSATVTAETSSTVGVARPSELAELIALFESIPGARALASIAPTLHRDHHVTLEVLQIMAGYYELESKESGIRDLGLATDMKMRLRLVLEHLKRTGRAIAST